MIQISNARKAKKRRISLSTSAGIEEMADF